MHNPHFHRLCGYDISNMTSKERRNNVIKNPHLADWFFHHTMSKFVNNWLKNTLQADWYWYRYEFQHRGSVHLHGLARLKYGPDMNKLTQQILSDFKSGTYNRNCMSPAEIKLCNFADWLISAKNPNPAPPLGTWTPPNIHPCQTEYKEETEDKDYIDL